MGKMSLDFSKFKKVHEDDKIATLQHKDGHEIRLAKKQLPHHMRKEIASLKLHEPKQSNPKLEESKKTLKFDDGGTVPKPQPSSGPVLDPDKVKAFQSSSIFNPSGEKPKQNYDDGGKVEKPQSGPYIDPKAAKEVEQGATQSGWQPEQWKKNIKEGLGLAEGGMVANKKENYDDQKVEYEPYDDKLDYEPVDKVDYEPIKDKKVRNYADGTPDGPISVNTNPQIPAYMLNPSPGSQSEQNAITKSPQDPGDLPYGVSSEDLTPQAPGMQRPGAQQAPLVLSSPTPSPSEAQEEPDPFGTKTMSDYYGLGYKEADVGIQAQELAEQQRATLEARQAQEQIDAQKHVQTDYQTHLGNLTTDVNSLIKEIRESKITPNQYLGSMDTGQKISTAIGLVLGGLGGGLTHQGNPALDFLNKQIDRDIAAQQANIGVKMSLVDAYQKQFGNINDGANMARASLQAITADQMRLAAAKSNNTMASARALQMAGQLDMQSASIRAQLAAKKTLLGPYGGAVPPEVKISTLASSPQEAEAAGKELTAVRNHGVQTASIIDAFKKAAQENTIAGRAGRAGFEPPSIGVFQSLIMPYLKDAEGRINESELARTDKLIPKPLDTDAMVMEKYKGLVSFLNEKAPQPVLLPKFGIDPRQFQRGGTIQGRPIQ